MLLQQNESFTLKNDQLYAYTYSDDTVLGKRMATSNHPHESRARNGKSYAELLIYQE